MEHALVARQNSGVKARKREAGRKREFWVPVVAEFERRSLKRREFCEARGLHFYRFRYWLYQLRREQREQSSRRYVPLVATETACPAPCKLRVGSSELTFTSLPHSCEGALVSEGRARALVLGGTQGNLACDGFSAYGCLSTKRASRNRSGCWSQGRRGFYEAIPAGCEEHENREVLGLIADLYSIEDEAEPAGILGTPEHLELRQRKSKPIVRRIWRWVDARHGTYSPSSKMAEALNYATQQRERLEQLLHDPELKLDNHVAERALRIVAMGRKRSLFSGSPEHAQNLAMLLTIIATCRLHAVNPHEYLRDMLIRIQTHPRSRIGELMPWRWRPPDS